MYEQQKPNILIVFAVTLIDLIAQTASKTLFREPSPAISRLLHQLAFSPEKRENTLKVFIRIFIFNLK